MDLALHEVVNSIWKHEYIIKDIKGGVDFVSIIIDLIDSGAIVLVSPNKRLIEKAYHIAAKYKTTFYDCIFVALAMEMGLTLKTLDGKQERILKTEKSK